MQDCQAERKSPRYLRESQTQTKAGSVIFNFQYKNFMKNIIQFHIYKGEKYYVAEGIDLPIVTQGKTLDKLALNIKEAVELQLEEKNFAEFDLSSKPSVLLNFELETEIHA